MSNHGFFEKNEHNFELLKKVATELNSVLNLSPKIDITYNAEFLAGEIKDVVEADGLLTPDDVFSKNVTQYLRGLGWKSKTVDDNTPGIEKIEDGLNHIREKRQKTYKPRKMKKPSLMGFVTKLLMNGGDIYDMYKQIKNEADKMDRVAWTPAQIRAHAKSLSKRGASVVVDGDKIKVVLSKN